MNKSKSGFTLVELLIVIVVIAILAAITIVAYNGVTQRANSSSAQSAVSQVSQAIVAYNIDKGNYPAALSDINVNNTSTTTYTYRNYGTSYCIAAITGGQSYQVEGDAPPTYGNCVDIKVSVYNSSGSDYVTYSGTPVVQGTLTAPFNYSWGAGSALPGGPVDHFAAVLTGYITPPTTGTYTFYSYADDRGFFSIGNTLVVNGTGTSASTVTGTIDLTAGQRYPFTYIFGENTGSATMALTWSYPGQNQASIPASVISG